MNVFDRTEFTIPELAIMLDLHRNTVYKRVARGYVDAAVPVNKYKSRKHYRIPLSWIVDMYPKDWEAMLRKLARYAAGVK